MKMIVAMVVMMVMCADDDDVCAQNSRMELPLSVSCRRVLGGLDLLLGFVCSEFTSCACVCTRSLSVWCFLMLMNCVSVEQLARRRPLDCPRFFADFCRFR